MALFTTAQITRRLPGYEGSSQDALVLELATLVDTLFAQWCGWPIPSGSVIPTLESSTYVQRLDGPRFMDGRALDLEVAPIVSVTEVVVSSTWDFSSGQTGTEGSDFELDADAGLLWMMPGSTLGATWPRSTRGIRATFVAGFATPLANEHPLVELGAQAVKFLMDKPNLLSSRSLSVSGQTFQPDELERLLPGSVRAGLRPWVQWGSRAG